MVIKVLEGGSGKLVCERCKKEIFGRELGYLVSFGYCRKCKRGPGGDDGE